MAATLSQIREGLKANLGSIGNCQVSAYLLGNPTPGRGSIEITLDEDVEYVTMGRATIVWPFVVRAYVGTPTDVGAQKNLDALMDTAGATSVRAALESDKTLGGIVDDLEVVAVRPPRIYSRAGGPEFLGAEWRVDVMADGT